MVHPPVSRSKARARGPAPGGRRSSASAASARVRSASAAGRWSGCRSGATGGAPGSTPPASSIGTRPCCSSCSTCRRGERAAASDGLSAAVTGVVDESVARGGGAPTADAVVEAFLESLDWLAVGRRPTPGSPDPRGAPRGVGPLHIAPPGLPLPLTTPSRRTRPSAAGTGPGVGSPVTTRDGAIGRRQTRGPGCGVRAVGRSVEQRRSAPDPRSAASAPRWSSVLGDQGIPREEVGSQWLTGGGWGFRVERSGVKGRGPKQSGTGHCGERCGSKVQWHGSSADTSTRSTTREG